MIYHFETEIVIQEAQRLMKKAELLGMLGAQMAQDEARSQEQVLKFERAAFYKLIGTYCYYMECESHSVGERFHRVLTQGRQCYWPQYSFIQVDLEWRKCL